MSPCQIDQGQMDRSQYADARRMRFLLACAQNGALSKESMAMAEATNACGLDEPPKDPDYIRTCLDEAMAACGWPE